MRTRSLARPLACLLGVLGLGCGSPAPPPAAGPEVHVNAGVEPVSLDPGPFGAEPGLREARWSVDGASRSASLWLPEGQPRSVIVMLHGAIPAAGAAPDVPSVARRLLRCLAMPAFEGLSAVVIAPHGERGQWWMPADTAFVLGLVAAARQRWPELASRSVVTGYSNGGIASWYFARLYPEWFAAAIPMAFDHGIVGKTRLPVYAIQGDRDELFAIEPVRAAIARARAEGVDVTLAERHRAGHMTPCAYVPELRAAGGWLEHHAFARARASAAP